MLTLCQTVCTLRGVVFLVPTTVLEDGYFSYSCITGDKLKLTDNGFVKTHGVYFICYPNCKDSEPMSEVAIFNFLLTKNIRSRHISTSFFS